MGRKLWTRDVASFVETKPQQRRLARIGMLLSVLFILLFVRTIGRMSDDVMEVSQVLQAFLFGGIFIAALAMSIRTASADLADQVKRLLDRESKLVFVEQYGPVLTRIEKVAETSWTRRSQHQDGLRFDACGRCGQAALVEFKATVPARAKNGDMLYDFRSFHFCACVACGCVHRDERSLDAVLVGLEEFQVHLLEHADAVDFDRRLRASTVQGKAEGQEEEEQDPDPADQIQRRL